MQVRDYRGSPITLTPCGDLYLSIRPQTGTMTFLFHACFFFQADNLSMVSLEF